MQVQICLAGMLNKQQVVPVEDWIHFCSLVSINRKVDTKKTDFRKEQIGSMHIPLYYR